MDDKKKVRRNTIGFFFLLFQITVIFGCSDDLEMSESSPLPVQFEITRFELFFDIDPENGVFNSNQVITVSTLVKTRRIIFDLHSEFTISKLSIQELDGTVIPISSWEELSEVNYNRGAEKEIFSRIEVQLDNDLAPGDKFNFLIDYHIIGSHQNNSNEDELLNFTFSTAGSRAIHPISGTFPYFGKNVAAPFRMEIRFPVGQFSCVPGTRMSSLVDQGFITEVYESRASNIPVFYIGPGERISRSQNDISIEYILAPGQIFNEEIADKTFEAAQLFNQHFGTPGITEYRIAFIKVPASSITGESKGNAIYFAFRDPEEYMWDENTSVNFLNLICHELFHNWNLWNIEWNGEYYEWFVEGGAGFVSSWASELILGNSAAAQIRKDFVDGYTNNEGFRATKTLRNATKANPAERSLIYSYGALVWEQLRNKFGDENLFFVLKKMLTQEDPKFIGFENLLDNLHIRTNLPVADYLNQWMSKNAKIDLKVEEVNIQQTGSSFKNIISINVDTEFDYEIFTSLGYKTVVNGEMESIDIHITKKGIHQITFISDDPPVFIQIDPFVRVPQINYSNNTWKS